MPPSSQIFLLSKSGGIQEEQKKNNHHQNNNNPYYGSQWGFEWNYISLLWKTTKKMQRNLNLFKIKTTTYTYQLNRLKYFD